MDFIMMWHNKTKRLTSKMTLSDCFCVRFISCCWFSGLQERNMLSITYVVPTIFYIFFPNHTELKNKFVTNYLIFFFALSTNFSNYNHTLIQIFQNCLKATPTAEYLQICLQLYHISEMKHKFEWEDFEDLLKGLLDG